MLKLVIMPNSGRGVRPRPAEKPLPYLRGADRTTLYFIPLQVNKNSRSGLTISTSVASTLSPACSMSVVIAHTRASMRNRLSSFSLRSLGLGVSVRSACLAFFAPAWSSGASSKSFAPLSISLSVAITSAISSSESPNFRKASIWVGANAPTIRPQRAGRRSFSAFPRS